MNHTITHANSMAVFYLGERNAGCYRKPDPKFDKRWRALPLLYKLHIEDFIAQRTPIKSKIASNTKNCLMVHCFRIDEVNTNRWISGFKNYIYFHSLTFTLWNVIFIFRFKQLRKYEQFAAASECFFYY